MRRGEAIILRGHTWFLDARINGTRYKVRLGKHISRSVAAELAAVQRSRILRGESGIGSEKKRDMAFEAACEKFLEWSAANKRPGTTRGHRLCVTQLLKSFRGRRLSQIGSFAIERHKFNRKGSPVRANRELQTLKRLFYWCMGQRPPLFEGENPLRKTKDGCAPAFFEESAGRLRFLEPAEEAALLAAAKEPLRTMIVLGVNAGLRLQSEGLSLEWASVDARLKSITILSAYAKNKRPRVVPLNEPARASLARLKASATGPYVFEQRDGRPYRSLRTAFLTDVTPHVLRHTFATRLVAAGVDMRTVQELGGWQTLKMVERYSHVNDQRKAEAVKRLAAFPPGFPPTEVAELAAVR